MKRRYFMLTAEYVDTCLPCYLQDSYSRDGETLLLSPLGLTHEETVEELINSIDHDCGLPEEFGDDDLREVVGQAIEGIDLRDVDANGNRVDEPIEDDSGDFPYIYVRLSWETD
jgi:hypothetical protein